MSERKLSSREKIVKSALALYSRQGITATTTKEIAEQASVNEVTLFRQFGSKQGLLLAVLQEAPFIESMQAALADIIGANQPLTAYSSAGLELLNQVPELVRSLIGEAGQSPLENQQALAKALQQANQQTVMYLQGERFSHPNLSLENSAKLLNTIILGYALMEASSNGQTLWQNQAAFLDAVNSLFSTTTPSTTQRAEARSSVTDHDDDNRASNVLDLPAERVREIFQKAKKQDPQTYALVYVLFGAGLRLEECAGLMRSHIFVSKTQHRLTITGPHARQVPVNRWVMGNRYGTYLKNPLTQWIKSRSDAYPEVFVTEVGEALTPQALSKLWAGLLSNMESSIGIVPTPFHARQTWCIELLSKGMSLDNLSLLSGLSLEDLAPYAKRTKEKAALEQAIAIDQKN